MGNDGWPRQFSSRTPKWLAILLGVVFGGFGLLFVVLDFPQMRQMKPTMASWIGLGFAVLGPVIGWAIYHFRTDIEINCTPDGFTLVKETRKGKTEEMYLWSDVTATRYWETESRDNEKKTTKITSHYEATGPDGQLFQFSVSCGGGFDNLIQTFNDHAAGVPYRWETQMGFNLSFAGIGVKRSRYTQVPRAAATT
jgi:hypothetical protein